MKFSTLKIILFIYAIFFNDFCSSQNFAVTDTIKVKFLVDMELIKNNTPLNEACTFETYYYGCEVPHIFLGDIKDYILYSKIGDKIVWIGEDISKLKYIIDFEKINVKFFSRSVLNKRSISGERQKKIPEEIVVAEIDRYNSWLSPFCKYNFTFKARNNKGDIMYNRKIDPKIKVGNTNIKPYKLCDN